MKRRIRLGIGLALLVVATQPQTALAEETALVMDYENFQEITIVEDENCTFKITGFEMREDGSYAWNAQIENKTDKELMFSMSKVSINGYMCDPYWAYSLAAGVQEDSSVEWYSGDLTRNAISHVEEVKFGLKIYDNADWMAEPLVDDYYTVSCQCGEADLSAAETVEGQTLLDNENGVFIVKEMYADEEMGYSWDIYTENKSEEDLIFSLEDVAVNDFESDPYCYYEITAGSKLNATINWYPESFKEIGIEEVYSVDGRVVVHAEDYWETGNTADEPFAVYPLGEDAVQPQERTAVEGERVVIDNEYCTVIVEDMYTDDYSSILKLYLENKTDSSMMYAVDEVLVNGVACDPYWADTIPAGKKGYSTMYWFEEELTSNGIEELETVEGTIRIYDDDNSEIDDYVDEKVVFFDSGAGVDSETEAETNEGVETEVIQDTEAETDAEVNPMIEEAENKRKERLNQM